MVTQYLYSLYCIKSWVHISLVPHGCMLFVYKALYPFVTWGPDERYLCRPPALLVRTMTVSHKQYDTVIQSVGIEQTVWILARIWLIVSEQPIPHYSTLCNMRWKGIPGLLIMTSWNQLCYCMWETWSDVVQFAFLTLFRCIQTGPIEPRKQQKNTNLQSCVGPYVVVSVYANDRESLQSDKLL